MKDTEGTNLPVEENDKLDETKTPVVETETTPEEDQTVSLDTVEEVKEPVAEEVAEAPEETPAVEKEAVVENSVVEEEKEAGLEQETSEKEESNNDAGENNTGKLTKEEILEKLTELVSGPVESSRNEIEGLKQAFYKLHRSEADELKKAFIEEGGVEEDFVPPVDETEEKIKEQLNIYKEKRASLYAKEEEQRQANYALKLQLINRLKELTESQEDFNKLYNEFKEIQQRWKEVKAVPQEYANELWKNYQIYNEKFYDLIKINNQFREYDFKKNLELKNALIEAVEKLQTEPDVISAFHQLQKLHQQWREIGPVAKDIREEVWGRFKAASTIINKRHQEHFEKVKHLEQENLDLKTAICEKIEAIDYTELKTFRDWENKNKEVIGYQNQWKSIGFAPKKYNVKIFERFRSACDVYFGKKSEFYKDIKGEMEKNLDLKRALCEKAEALKDSTEWKASTEKMIALQKEWKTIGSVSRKHSDAIWKRFISACDYFFEQKNKNFTSQKSGEQDNLKAKKAVIANVNALNDEEDNETALAKLKEYMAQWNEIGFVPFKEKDKIYNEYHQAVDAQFDRLNVDKNERRMETFRNNLSEMGEKGKGKLYGEREKLMRMFERMKNELQTYENNIGFLSISSKGGGGLLKEMERKIEKIKEEMSLIVKKIEAIDENLE